MLGQGAESGYTPRRGGPAFARSQKCRARFSRRRPPDRRVPPEEPPARGMDPLPKFQGKLTDEEIRDTARYVQELAKRAEGRK